MNKMMKKMFNFESDVEKQFEDIAKSSPKSKSEKSPKNNPFTKSYSISYKWNSDMKEPEINVQGDVDEDSMKRFMAGINRQFDMPKLDGKFISLMKPKLESPPDETSEIEQGHEPKGAQIENCEEPYCDITDTDTGAIITLEMPGISAENAKVEFKNDTLIVTGNYEDRKYHREIKLRFKADPNPKIEARNGLFIIELQRMK
jgi:HSP20 family molecular chaperone IbpA